MHVPVAPQSPEQQSVPTAHLLPAVLQELFRVPQAPFTQEPLQHCAALVHFCASDTQTFVAHLPPVQLKLQQSVEAAQPSPAAAQAPTTEAHFPVLGSQMPEQHSSLWTQTAPNALHAGPLAAPPCTALAPLAAVLDSPPSAWPAPLLPLVAPPPLVAPVLSAPRLFAAPLPSDPPSPA